MEERTSAVLVALINSLLQLVSSVQPDWLPLISDDQALLPLTSAGQCGIEAMRLRDENSRQLIQPPQLNGTWTSASCETLVYGEFAMRYVQFYDEGRFLMRHYRYDDFECTQPRETLLVRGTVQQTGRSLNVPGATQTIATLERVEIIPYTKRAAKKLTDSLRRTCRVENDKEFPWPDLLPYRLVTVHQNRRSLASRRAVGLADDETDEIDCAHSVNFSIGGFQLIRQDERRAPSGSYSVRELYLGIVLWDTQLHTERSPTHFMPPLRSTDKSFDCPVCLDVIAADELRPPMLKKAKPAVGHAPRPSEHLNGDWISTTCESHIHGMYVHRQMSYLADAKLWVLRHRFYNDPLCRTPSYTLTVRGVYEPQEMLTKRRLPTTQRITYKIQGMQIMPESQIMADNFKYARNCGPPDADWSIGKNVDLTESGGCHALGLLVPSEANDLARLQVSDWQVDPDEDLLLFTGDLATIDRYSRLPSTFRVGAMRKCKELTVVVSLEGEMTDVPMAVDMTEHGRYMLWQSNGSTSGKSLRTLVIGLIVGVFVLLLHLSR